MKRDSFILYTDFYDVLKEIPDEQAGMLFKAIYEYQATGKVPTLEDSIKYVFLILKQKLDENETKWRTEKEKRSEAGRKSGEIRKKTVEQDGTMLNTVEQNEAMLNTVEECSDVFNTSEQNGTMLNNVEECSTLFNTLEQSGTKRTVPVPVPVTVFEEEEEEEAAAAADGEPPPAAPAISENQKKPNSQIVVDLYHSICKSFPKVRAISEIRKKAIKARFASGYTLDDFREVFTKAESSAYLKGANERNWSADFDWLIKDANMAKTLEGKYDHIRGKPEKGVNNAKTEHSDWGNLLDWIPSG